MFGLSPTLFGFARHWRNVSGPRIGFGEHSCCLSSVQRISHSAGKGRFAPDRLKTLSESGEPAVCWTASEVSAPLLLLIVLCLRADAKRYHKNNNENRYDQRPRHPSLPAYEPRQHRSCFMASFRQSPGSRGNDLGSIVSCFLPQHLLI